MESTTQDKMESTTQDKMENSAFALTFGSFAADIVKMPMVGVLQEIVLKVLIAFALTFGNFSTEFIDMPVVKPHPKMQHSLETLSSVLPEFELTFGDFPPDIVVMPMGGPLTKIQLFLSGFTDGCRLEDLFLNFGNLDDQDDICIPSNAEYEISKMRFVECSICGDGCWEGNGSVSNSGESGCHDNCDRWAREEEWDLYFRPSKHLLHLL